MKNFTLILSVILLLGAAVVFVYDTSLWYISIIMSAIATIISLIQVIEKNDEQ